ncbi:hypothetical protein NY057_06755 [Curtobacterium flaccumfaciens]|jgi:hypothetical protein|uniref:hypothetical protein n=1 Tax=Curtobacterium flaccumfaciens TaxID=2035 RepID=UPI002175E06E|nr:hypothetical protein [Curtobacterium flaccumfaciens]MCS5493355.1 hypothetical protein [Curtobacterium flaccumfaciens pv. flaccumfaciens]UWD80451.1 hypothetical protein NY058_06635 [Curtobacterium flaccumfaciens]UWD83937.1 hypothetical protein NY057_06755 [Curtobacterium flaccumfaciens]
MVSFRSALPLVVVSAVLVSGSLAGCSADADAAARPTSTPTPTSETSDAQPAGGATDPMEEDRSAAAICGQITALTTISLNATVGRSQGDLSEAQYQALIAAERFGYEHLSSTDEELDDAIDYAHEYLDAHPAPKSGPALEMTPEWELVGRTLITACRGAGSNVVGTAQYGG